MIAHLPSFGVPSVPQVSLYKHEGYHLTEIGLVRATSVPLSTRPTSAAFPFLFVNEDILIAMNSSPLRPHHATWCSNAIVLLQ